MSGGATGLGGYIYQQDYLAYRVLASVVARTLDGGGLPSLQSFKIEGRASESGPSWDLILSDSAGGKQLLECKDTEIAKDDRAIFYKRARREVVSGADSETIQVGWVTDREKQGNILMHLTGISALIYNINAVPESSPSSVISASTALEEAIYFLCHPNPFQGKEMRCDPIPLASAKSLLRRLTVDCWSGASLRDAVALLVDKVFQAGTAESLVQYIRGHLTSEIREFQTPMVRRGVPGSSRHPGVPDTHAPESHGLALGTTIVSPASSSNVLMAQAFETQCSGHPLR